MLAADRSAAFRDRRDRSAADPEIIQAHGRRDDIHDRIQRAYFVEMHLLHGNSMRPGFRLREDPEDPERQRSRAFRHLKPADDLPDLGHPRVVVMVIMIVVMVAVVLVLMVVMVVVVMTVLVVVTVLMFMIVIMMMAVVVMIVVMSVLQMPVQVCHIVVVPVVLFIKDHVKIAAVDAGFLHPSDLDPKAAAGDPFENTAQLLLVRAQVQERRNGHISADPCAAFQV